MNLLGAIASISACFHFDLAYRFLMRMPAFNRRELVWRLCAAEQVDSVTFRSEGFLWSAPMTSGVPLALFRAGNFQGSEVRALAAWIRRHGLLDRARTTIIDVGANIGTTTLPLVRELDCRVLAIEPEPRNRCFLQRNVHDNGGADSVTIAPFAVLRQPGVIRMLLPGDDPGGFCVDRANARQGIRAGAVANAVDAQADRLDAISARYGIPPEHVALVWSDTQGCEADVMETGACFWAAGAPLFAEVEPLSLRRQGAYESFPSSAARYFERYIEAGDLMRHGAAAPSHSIANFPGFLRSVGEDATLDVLFLPPAFLQKEPL